MEAPIRWNTALPPCHFALHTIEQIRPPVQNIELRLAWLKLTNLLDFFAKLQLRNDVLVKFLIFLKNRSGIIIASRGLNYLFRRNTVHCQTCQTAEDVFRIVRDKEISFIQIWFTDILGVLKSFSIRPSELEEAMTEGMGFDGSSIEGFSRIEESDMIAKPDPTTFQVLPWRPDEKPVARMFCDILTPDGSPYPGDPRYVLKRMVAKAAEKGFTSYLGPELEFFILQQHLQKSWTRAAISMPRLWIWPTT
jgi:hypothetical protein